VGVGVGVGVGAGVNDGVGSASPPPQALKTYAAITSPTAETRKRLMA